MRARRQRRVPVVTHDNRIIRPQASTVRCRAAFAVEGESLSKVNRQNRLTRRREIATDRPDRPIETAMNNGDKAPAKEALGQRGRIRRRLRCSQVRSPTWASRHTPNRRGRCGRCIHRTALCLSEPHFPPSNGSGAVGHGSAYNAACYAMCRREPSHAALE